MEKVLGSGWEYFRWYASAEERDRAFEHLTQQPPYYRQGDVPTQIMTKVER